MTTVPMLVGLPTEEMRRQLQHGRALLTGCVGDPRNPVIACLCLNCSKWKTPDMRHWQLLPQDFGTLSP